jgi:pimeloyl-ACP methyl ester carboxylesterase
VPFIESPNIRLFYKKTGNGPITLLLFHGFGQDHRVFDQLGERLGIKYTVYAFDLFFHGQSEWLSKDQSLGKEIWGQMILQFLAENKIENFSVMGFSMGGKFSLATLELFPDRVKEITLLAPDGIKTNFWYSLATYPLAFRKLFKSMVSNHGRFLAVARIALQLRLIDRGVLRFVEFQMNTSEKRKKVYYSWVVFRHFKFNLNSIAQIINSKKIRFRLFIGKHDKIITAKNMESFMSKLDEKDFQVIEAGHNDLIQHSLSYILKG